MNTNISAWGSETYLLVALSFILAVMLFDKTSKKHLMCYIH